MTHPENKAIPTRDQAAPETTWDLTRIYATPQAWEADFADLKQHQSEIETTYRGKLGSRENVLAALTLFFQQLQSLQTLYTYAELYKAQDNGNADAQAKSDRIMSLYSAWSASTSFLQPELLTLPEETLREYAKDPAFTDYSVYLMDIVRERPHTLDAAQEKLLSMAGEVFAAQGNVYDMLTYVDLAFPDLTGEDGQALPLSEGTYSEYLRSPSRPLRKQAFETLLSTYGKYRNTLSATYTASVKQDVFSARVRNFDTARDRALFPDQVPGAVYDGLIQAVHEALPTLNRYTALRTKVLGIDETHLYDLYVSMVPDFDLKQPYDEAYDLVTDALSIMGPDYQRQLREAKAGRWIDVYENKGKTTGAFSHGGAYAVHPYVLLNYKPGLDETLTIAHEMGHALHSARSAAAQPFPKAEYTIFAAEVASTVNEVLVLEALLDRYPEHDAQAALLGHLLEGFRTTVFRQTMFAEFELLTHQMAERGEPLTAESLDAAYLALNEQYYGAAAVIDPAIAHEWSRIPHFYSAFYVYKYATGFTAAVALARRIREGGDEAVADYHRFLALGGSLPPIEALKIAGVDMSTQAPVRSALSYFAVLLDRFEKLLEGQDAGA